MVMMTILMGTLFESYLCGKTIGNVDSRRNLFLLWQKPQIKIHMISMSCNLHPPCSFGFDGKMIKSQN